MNHKEYNGYTNYETWVVALWMDNERGTHDYWLSAAADVCSKASPEYIAEANMQRVSLAEKLKDEHEEALPEITGFACDLLNAAMSEVDWFDIAESLINTVNEEAA